MTDGDSFSAAGPAQRSGPTSAYTPAEQRELADFLRAAEVGLLTAHGGGYYTIHPALPWFFKGLFDEYWPAGEDAASGPSEISNLNSAATRAFVEALGVFGMYYFRQYERGNRDVIAALAGPAIWNDLARPKLNSVSLGPCRASGGGGNEFLANVVSC